jgi:imidazole glycerol-phosphate synthase subunit HisH
VKTGIIRYSAGNIYSVSMALERLGASYLVSDNPEVLQPCDRIIFPGVGEAASALKDLDSKGLTEFIKSYNRPFLGICLGMQILCRDTEENNAGGLGIFSPKVRKFRGELKIPHMGWNTLHSLNSVLFTDIPEESSVYFVHSYYAEQSEESSSICHYGLDFSASLEKDNTYGVQFHPEKSGETGSKILQNFLEKT